MNEITNWPQAFSIVGVAFCVAIVICCMCIKGMN